MTYENRRPRGLASGQVTIVGRSAARIGFGAMRLDGVWSDRTPDGNASLVLRRAVELGVQVIDTAWYYGDNVANRLIAKSLRPYKKDLLIATKLGYARSPGGALVPAIDPRDIRAGNELDLRTLELDSIELTHLRWTGGDQRHGGVALADAVGTMVELQEQGRVRHIGLSNVTISQLQEALKMVQIASVSNAFSFGNQSDWEVLDFCSQRGIPYLPFFPLGGGQTQAHPTLARIAARTSANVSQVALGWLLARSPVILPIPGTSRVEHLEENLAAAALVFDDIEMVELGLLPRHLRP